MKHLFVTDRSPNGTNDLIITNDDFDVIESLDECTFGINVGSDAFELEPECFVKEVSLAVLIQNLAVSPVRTKAQAYTRLMKTLNGGVK